MMPIANAMIGSLQLPLVSCSLALGPITVSKDRRRQIAGTFSGGEQQMLAIARGLMSDPGILIIDELSLGLAPVVVHQLFDTLKALKETGISILLVEQNVHLAFAISDYTHVMAQGSFSPKASLPDWPSGPIFAKPISDSSVARSALPPESGHVRCKLKCPLWTKSGHGTNLFDHLVGGIE